jgi:hypothetical protein
MANAPSPSPAAPACELRSTDSNVMIATNSTPKTSHAPAAANSGPVGATPKMNRVPAHVTSVPASTVIARNAECTSALATTNATRDTGFVSTRIAVPLLLSEDTIPP